MNLFFDRYDGGEEVTMVCIKARHCVLIFAEAFFEHLLVVCLSGVHSQIGVKGLCGVDCVADPFYVADVVFLSFVNSQEHVYRFVIVFSHAVMRDLSIAITEFVIFVNNSCAVIGKIAVNELFLAEKLQQVAVLVGLFHCPLELAVREHFVAVDINLVYLNLAVFIHIHVENHMILF